MAKPLIVTLGEAQSSFDVTLLERRKIYGTRRRIALDAQGRDCTRAALTLDGRLLLTTGMTGQGYFTPSGQWVPRAQMQGLDAAGQPVPTQPSTLGTAQSLEGPLPPQALLELDVEGVYHLAPMGEGPLLERLRKGEVFRCPFNFSAGLTVETAYLVGNPEGFYAVVGQPQPAPMIEEARTWAPAPSDPQDDGDELDFDSL